MKVEDHIECARQWGETAKNAEEQGFELVLVHARFYEAANFIDAFLANARIHTDDHMDRVRKMYESGLFTFDEVQFFEKATRQRGIVEFQMPSRPLREAIESGRIFRERWETMMGPAEQPKEETSEEAPPAEKKTSAKKAPAKKKAPKKTGKKE